MAVTDRITEKLNELVSSGEMYEYVHELLLTKQYSISKLYDDCKDMDEAIRQELSSLNMEPNYKGYGEFMIPISRKEALSDFDKDFPVFLIYPNDAEGLCDDRKEIESGDFYFANEIQTPQRLVSERPDINLKMIYIASPLRGDYNRNIKNTVEYCRLASEHGVLPMAPHIIVSQWCNDTIPEQREQGLALGLALLSKSEELWVMGTQISEGMRGEIAFATEHGIPTFYVEHPHDPKYYPVSANENTLLCKQDCLIDSHNEDYQDQTVILRYETLKPEYRTPLNQIWTATHGSGCQADCGVFSDTVHLLHPVDGDRMAVGRFEIYGIAKPEVLEILAETYPALTAQPQAAEEQDEEMCL